MVIGIEKGESGTPYLQGYVEFAKRITYMKFVKMIGRNFHAESRKGTQKQALDYCKCKKEENYQEWGTPRTQGKINTDIRANTNIAEMVKGLEDGRSIKELIKCCIRNY